MRTVPIVLVSAAALALAPKAHADNGVSFDFGYLQERVAITDDTAIGGQGGRFAIRVANGEYFHWGAEAEEASLAGQTQLPNGYVARSATSGSPRSFDGPLDGNMLGLKMFVGAHARTGHLMFSGDVAAGVRDTYVSSDLGMDVAGRKGETLLEARTRADFFVSPSITLGAVASTDLIEHRDVSFGAVMSLYFSR
jgi:hypothetical protein